MESLERKAVADSLSLNYKYQKELGLSWRCVFIQYSLPKNEPQPNKAIRIFLGGEWVSFERQKVNP